MVRSAVYHDPAEVKTAVGVGSAVLVVPAVGTSAFVPVVDTWRQAAVVIPNTSDEIVAILVASTRPLDPDHSTGVLAVYFYAHRQTMVVPPEVAPISLWSLRVFASDPCVLIIQRDSNTPGLIEVAVADPTQRLKSVALAITGRNLSNLKCSSSSDEDATTDTELTLSSANGTIANTITVPLPAGELAGSSVQLHCVTEP